jgi:hypothetical protein
MTTIEQPKRGRGRPKGSKNRRPPIGHDHEGLAKAPLAAAVDPSPPSAAGTQRAMLEADRDRLLKSIADAAGNQCAACLRGGDAKIEAALQSQLNGVNRMLLAITGERAPSDVSLMKAPQWGRLKAKLFDCLAKKHPAAWAALLELEAEG